MGTRLYVSTNKPEVLEILAGVPRGTAAKLEDLEQLRSDMGSDAWYDMMDQHPDASTLWDFRLFGFGKLNGAQWDLAKEICEDDDVCCGHTEDPEQMLAMLNETADFWKSRLGLINISDLTNVHWS